MNPPVNSLAYNSKFNRALRQIKKEYWLYLMLIPGLIFYILFKIKPFFGIYLAFSNYSPVNPNIFAGEFVGLEHFRVLFQGNGFWILLRNTLVLSVYNIIFFFPLPIILALLLNEVRWNFFKRMVQTITYIPHFFSWVVIAGISYTMLTMDGGGVNNLLDYLFGVNVSFLSSETWFRPVIIMQQIWKDVGWGTIIYLAAMTSIDLEMYEAAAIDGATRFQRIRYITLPSIMPTIATLLILRMGSFMDSGFDQLFLMVNAANAPVGQVFDTFIYEQGIKLGRLSYTTAAGLFKSLVSLFMVLMTNKIAKRMGNDGII